MEAVCTLVIRLDPQLPACLSGVRARHQKSSVNGLFACPFKYDPDALLYLIYYLKGPSVRTLPVTVLFLFRGLE